VEFLRLPAGQFGGYVSSNSLSAGGDASEALRLAQLLSRVQLADGSWPAFVGDRASSWTTALAVCALNSVSDPSSARERGESWLLRTKGREGHWFWRWKFKTADRNVQFDPDKYGWPWISGSASWVVPTAFSIIAIKQFTVCNRSEASEKRIHLGVEMLLDRACVDGGWNSGNSVVYGVPLRPHVEATAIALLALQDERRTEDDSKELVMAATERSYRRFCFQSCLVHSQLVRVPRAYRRAKEQVGNHRRRRSRHPAPRSGDLR